MLILKFSTSHDHFIISNHKNIILNFEELKEFLEKVMILGGGRNFQPVVIKSLFQHEGKALKNEIIQKLQNSNSELDTNRNDFSVVFNLLSTTHSIIKFNESENSYEILDYETYTQEQKEWIINFCEAKIKIDTSGSKFWVWPVEQINWPTVRDEKVWAVGKKGKGSRVKKGDEIIFFLKGKGFFVGIFSVESDWHDRTIVWPDQKHGSEILSTGAEINLRIVQLGFADWGKLLYDLKFVEKKSPQLRGLSLRGTLQGPANSARPISQEDHDLILKEMIEVQKEPIAQKASRAIKETEHEVVALIDISDHEFELEKLPDPVKKTIEDIFKDVEKGKISVPKFQRYWTWDRQQIEELWESIFRSYYIGSLLHWETGEQRLGSTPVEGAPETEKNADYILDGQQRITAIYYAVKAPKIGLPNTIKPYVFFVNINALLDPRSHSSEIVDSLPLEVVEQKGFFDKKIQFRKKIFPLSELKNNGGSTWLFEFQDYLQDDEEYSKEDARNYYEKLNMIFGYVWSKYEIPVVKLSDTLSYENVIKVFERINSKGTPLDVFDLLNARFALYDIILKDEWEKVENLYENMKNWYPKNDKIPIYILQSLSLIKKEYLRRSQILTIDEEYKISNNFQNKEFLNDWNEMAGFVEEAIKRLTDTRFGFGAINYNLIPYTVMVPIIAALLKTIVDRDDKTSCMDKISLWYWNTISSDNYSGSTDSKGEADYKMMIDWFDNPDVQLFKNISVEDFNTGKKSSAIYKGIMCLIAKKGALDFIENDPPDYSKLEDHHIFPISNATKYNAKVGDINSILNRTLIFEKTNRWITNKDPSDYLTEIMNKQNIDEKEMRRRLETHLISSEAFDCMLKNDFNGFIKARKKTVIKEMNKVTGKQIPNLSTQTSPETPYDNIIILRSKVRECNEEILWVTKYFSESDLETLRLGMNKTVKKIRILLSRKRKGIKSEFKRFKEQFSEIECQMKVMSKDVENEIHGRYLSDKEKCYNMIDTEIAKRGQTDDIFPTKRPENLEKWWNESFDIIEDWNKFQD